MFTSVLIANRGAIAVRVIRTLKRLGIRSIAVYAEADLASAHVTLADAAISLGEGRASETYLDQAKILAAVRETGAEAVHPGYGFLSENAEFAEALEAAGVVFLGPTPAQMRAFGLKHEARAIAERSGVPLLPGTALLDSAADAVAAAETMGYPVMLKSTAGGGGIGMQVCRGPQQLRQHWDSVKRLGANNFANAGVFLEKFIERARHIEVQIVGDGKGAVLVLGDRDCSSQRRHQKVIEEAPAPGIADGVRMAMHRAAKALTEAVAYRNVGTVEFIFDADADRFYFLEMNTRLQVEHGVTELVFGVDLVEIMLKCACLELPELDQWQRSLEAGGHAVQARIYAENPLQAFRPSTGVLTALRWPLPPAQARQLRIDHWLSAGVEISPFYDPMLAKIMVLADDRERALEGLGEALGQTQLQGVETNTEYVRAILATEVFRAGRMTTGFLGTFSFTPSAVEVVQSGTMTTLQDYPGRVGYWHVGVPPSGPFDDLAFRLGNALLGNDPACAGLEITVNGPTLKFHCAQAVVLTGAAMRATLDDRPVAFNQPFVVPAGGVLAIDKIIDAGSRAYLLFKGGIQCTPYLGACATFTLGQFGGLSGRALRAGDTLPVQGLTAYEPPTPSPAVAPVIGHHWRLHVVYGPHGAPDFFTEQDIAEFFAARWKVHYNSSRTGIRLLGPKPQWARTDGGEAGLHPSNIHDNAYAIGAVDFTGDMPVILGPDGPSLGGFVCPVTVIAADHWKLGQLAPGDTLEFVPVTAFEAVAALEQRQGQLQAGAVQDIALPAAALQSPVVAERGEGSERIVYRLQGESNLLVEYGPMQLDIRIRFRVHALLLWLTDVRQEQAFWRSCLLDLTPGVRSLQVHFDPLAASLDDVLALLERAEEALREADDLTVPSRVVHLPLSWDDEQCRIAVRKYMQSVRADAPWCPDNIEFIRRINGLESVDDVKDVVFDAAYVVLGLGDVYLGAPVATPLDPRHRLVTTKYNPARTWTAENSVGIGGSYLCVYGMEGPGGYQFVGRTLQMWNRYRLTEAFSQPWLLRFFDQIRFFEVSAEELQKIRREFPLGRYPLRIEETQFSLVEYENFLERHREQIGQFVAHRNRAFEKELEAWRAAGVLHFDAGDNAQDGTDETELADGMRALESPVSGSVWQMIVTPGQQVSEGDPVCVLESMKMEIDVLAPVSGTIVSVSRREGQQVASGQPLVIIQCAG